MERGLTALARAKFYDKLTQSERGKLIKHYKSLLQQWLPEGGHLTYEAYLQYQRTGVLPFRGGWLEQPDYIRNDFTLFDNVLDFIIINMRLDQD
jgi:hypothetical protein